jgi:hypothetical protein
MPQILQSSSGSSRSRDCRTGDRIARELRELSCGAFDFQSTIFEGYRGSQHFEGSDTSKKSHVTDLVIPEPELVESQSSDTVTSF